MVIKKNLKYMQVDIFESPVVVLILVRFKNLVGVFECHLNSKF